jgi:glycosyltransferase involved in cell wall biosynthesis
MSKKVDFWDIDKLVSNIISVLRYKEVRELLIKNGKSEMQKFSWGNSAAQFVDIYGNVMGRTLSNGVL